MNFLELDDAKDFLRIASSDTTKDALVGVLITVASNTIRGLIDATVEPLDAQVALVDGGHKALILPKFPVREIVTITDEVDEVELDEADYLLDSAPALVYLDSKENWSDGVRRFEVEFKPGPASVPEDIQSATLMLIASLYRSPDSSLASERIGDYSYTLASDGPVSPVIMSLLDRYIRPGF